MNNPNEKILRDKNYINYNTNILTDFSKINQDSSQLEYLLWDEKIKFNNKYHLTDFYPTNIFSKPFKEELYVRQNIIKENLTDFSERSLSPSSTKCLFKRNPKDFSKRNLSPSKTKVLSPNKKFLNAIPFIFREKFIDIPKRNLSSTQTKILSPKKIN